MKKIIQENFMNTTYDELKENENIGNVVCITKQSICRSKISYLYENYDENHKILFVPVYKDKNSEDYHSECYLSDIDITDSISINMIKSCVIKESCLL